MTASRTHPMSRVDTAWLRMDSDVNLMMIVGVWLLRPAIRHDALCERIRERLLKYERFRQKVVQGALGSQWVDDEHFDLGRHVVVGNSGAGAARASAPRCSSAWASWLRRRWTTTTRCGSSSSSSTTAEAAR